MHIDLNSCFATVAQQANPLLRNKPLVVAAYATPNGCVLSPSIEAKRYGIKTGMTVRDAHALYSGVLVRTPDPPMVRDVHAKFRKIFNDYSPHVTPKSIDEAIINFEHTLYEQKDLTEVAKEIKLRMRREIGEWISCSIGIGTNRFLAKTGASLHKPDGLDIISHRNLRNIYANLTLLDLCGINQKYQARLNMYGIFTPLQFFDASAEFLKKQVFESVVGYYWFLRLHGWEPDAQEFQRKSYGQEYSLQKPTSNLEELCPILMKLCEKMGRRLRASGHAAFGIHVACLYHDYTHWHRGRKLQDELYATVDLYKKALFIFNQQPERKIISKLAVSCYDLVPSASSQMNLFDTEVQKRKLVSDAMDKINDRYGEFVITPARMMGMDDLVLDRIAFGGGNEM